MLATCKRRKRTALDLEQEIQVIDDIEAGKKQSVVAASLSVAKQTVNTIWHDREKIRQVFSESQTNTRKRLRTAAYEDLEEELLTWFQVARIRTFLSMDRCSTAAYEDVEGALLKWFQVARSQNVPINEPLLYCSLRGRRRSVFEVFSGRSILERSYQGTAAQRKS